LRFHWYIWGNPPQLSCADGEQRFENSPAASPMVNFGLAKHCWNRFQIAFGGGEIVSQSRFAGPGQVKGSRQRRRSAKRRLQSPAMH
jgi:hypothetical protein